MNKVREWICLSCDTRFPEGWNHDKELDVKRLLEAIQELKDAVASAVWNQEHVPDCEPCLNNRRLFRVLDEALVRYSGAKE